MTREQKYDAVNNTTSLEELSKVILSFADEDGNIQGKERKFNAEEMAKNCLNFTEVPNYMLTRDFGIRQQAIMFKSVLI